MNISHISISSLPEGRSIVYTDGEICVTIVVTQTAEDVAVAKAATSGHDWCSPTVDIMTWTSPNPVDVAVFALLGAILQVGREDIGDDVRGLVQGHRDYTSFIKQYDTMEVANG